MSSGEQWRWALVFVLYMSGMSLIGWASRLQWYELLGVALLMAASAGSVPLQARYKQRHQEARDRGVR